MLSAVVEDKCFYFLMNALFQKAVIYMVEEQMNGNEKYYVYRKVHLVTLSVHCQCFLWKDPVPSEIKG